MRFLKVIFTVFISFLVLHGISSAQMCGDVNNDTKVNVTDIIATMDYVAGNPSTINLANADCDGITGITVLDVASLVQNVFRLGTLNCSPSGSYNFAAADDDTLYVYRIADIPDNVDEVFLLMAGSFGQTADAIFMPFHANGTGSSNHFSNTNFYSSQGNLAGVVNTGSGDYALVANPINDLNWYTGYRSLVLLRFGRDQSGIASIMPEAFDRETPWEISVARNNDLYTPVVSYIDVTYPDGILHAVEDDLLFNALTDTPSPDTLTLTIVNGIQEVPFRLYTSTPWIQLEETQGVTPATIKVTADATGLGALDYFGAVKVYYEEYTPLVDSIPVQMTVTAINPGFPPGDINCDGHTDILDLNYLVNYLFRFGAAPNPCE